MFFEGNVNICGPNVDFGGWKDGPVVGGLTALAEDSALIPITPRAIYNFL